VELLSLGVVATSLKPDERRLPIHPDHLGRLGAEMRGQIFLEQGYGARFGLPDSQLAGLVGGMQPRDQVLEECDVVVLPKPTPADLLALPSGRVLWGWPHSVQDETVTQIAIDRRLTLIAWESMNHWTRDGAFSLHVFHKNNELAGYCSVLHALQLTGETGAFGRRLRAAVIGFGATARGAVTALLALGIHDISVLTHRNVPAVAAPMAPARLVQYEVDQDRTLMLALTAERPVPVAAFLAEYDIVVNCILQDTDDPITFVRSDDLGNFRRGTLFVDVSCDEGMGFEWARPTSFAEPTVAVAPGITYYAVDHSPSYLWNSATWEISEALLPFLPVVASGRPAWATDETIHRAIEIRDGVIQNPRILSFQSRAPAFPHSRRK
jgi:alanine dehydrogenase